MKFTVLSPRQVILFALIAFAILAHVAAIEIPPPAPKPAVPAPPPPPPPKPPTPPPPPKPPTPPKPQPPTRPQPGIKPTRVIIPVENDDAASVFELGTYQERSEQVLFENFDGPTVPFFSKMYDFFAAQETQYLPDQNAYARATGSREPFKGTARPTGQRITLRSTITSPSTQTVTTTFDPQRPTDVCKLWASLANYCGGDENCACYSDIYYVPDQWNSLAAGCAAASTSCASSASWCSVASSADDYSSFCTQDDSAVKFAATANAGTTRAPRPQSGGDAAATQTPNVQRTSSPIIATATPSSSFSGFTTGGSSNSGSVMSWAPPSLASSSICGYVAGFFAFIMVFMV